jgi:hypothetical protein
MRSYEICNFNQFGAFGIRRYHAAPGSDPRGGNMRLRAIVGGLLTLLLFPSVAGATPLTFGFTFTSDDHMFMTDGTLTGDFIPPRGQYNWRLTELHFNALPPEILAIHNPFPYTIHPIPPRFGSYWFVSDANELVRGSLRWMSPCEVDCSSMRMGYAASGPGSMWLYNAHGDIFHIIEQVRVNGSVEISKVPEPASLTLFASGLLGVLAARRRRQSRGD